jgi:hypothetical protein
MSCIDCFGIPDSCKHMCLRCVSFTLDNECWMCWFESRDPFGESKSPKASPPARMRNIASPSILLLSPLSLSPDVSPASSPLASPRPVGPELFDDVSIGSLFWGPFDSPAEQPPESPDEWPFESACAPSRLEPSDEDARITPLMAMGPVPLTREKARMAAPDPTSPFSVARRLPYHLRARANSA